MAFVYKAFDGAVRFSGFSVRSSLMSFVLTDLLVFFAVKTKLIWFGYSELGVVYM